MEGKYDEDFEVPLKYELLSFSSKNLAGMYSAEYLEEFEDEKDQRFVHREDEEEEEGEVSKKDQLYTYDE